MQVPEMQVPDPKTKEVKVVLNQTRQKAVPMECPPDMENVKVFCNDCHKITWCDSYPSSPCSICGSKKLVRLRIPFRFLWKTNRVLVDPNQRRPS